MLTLLLCLAQVETGLDRLVAEQFAPLQDHNVAVLANHSAIDRRGRHLVDLLMGNPKLRVKALLAPEHGWRGELDQAVINHKRDENTGLTIYSLYGESRRPTATMLAGIDVLLFDIQDIGTRFYTYQTTLLYALEACADLNIALMVLDRPNPLGGHYADGPLLDQKHISFTGAHPMPVVHGLTMGELARFFVHRRQLDVDLQVVSMRGWQRGMSFADTGLPWINPSPNMRAPRQAMLYPGIALFEYTNLSVGRGTDTPFERLGAPWLDHFQLTKRLQQDGLPGVSFLAHRFTPTSGPYSGQSCNGMMIQLDDPTHFDPFLTAYQIFRHLRAIHPNQYEHARFIKLLAHEATFAKLLDAKQSLTTLRRQERTAANIFHQTCQDIMLYPANLVSE